MPFRSPRLRFSSAAIVRSIAGGQLKRWKG